MPGEGLKNQGVGAGPGAAMAGLRQEIAAGVMRFLAGGRLPAEVMVGEVYLNCTPGREVLSSLLAGHNILLVGPPGCGKTTLALNLWHFLEDTARVSGCPVNCLPGLTGCPWCRAGLSHGEAMPWPARERVVRLQGSGELQPEDLLGGVDPRRLLRYGHGDLRGMVPGRLWQANNALLVVDFLERMPGRVLGLLRYVLEGELVLPESELVLAIDTLVVATVDGQGLARLPGFILDYFDVIQVNYLESYRLEKGLLVERNIAASVAGTVVDVAHRSRHDPRLERGASTRAAVRFGELARAYSELQASGYLASEEVILRRAAEVSLAGAVKVHPALAESHSPEAIIDDMVVAVVSGRPQCRSQGGFLPREALENLAEEIAMNEEFRRDLKRGYFHSLVKMLKDNPSWELSKIFQRFLAGKLGESGVQGRALRALEIEALKEALHYLEEEAVLSSGGEGWRLSTESLKVLIGRLVAEGFASQEMPAEEGGRVGRRLPWARGEIIGVKPFTTGDGYRDLSLRDTLRRTVKRGQREIKREDLVAWQRENRTRLEAVLCLDVSSTMAELQKFWLAKKVALQLALTHLAQKDQVAVVSFANEAREVVSLSKNLARVSRALVDLEVELNAFTNIGAGLEAARKVLAKKPPDGGRRQIILISDGEATAPKDRPEGYALEQAVRMAREGIGISVVCLMGERSNPALMGRISRIGRGQLYIWEGGVRGTVGE
ncbi:MAG: VWA domain-containing protein [Clostridia bacterium]|nr:MAG: VWA domain-containing protein [Clostridia bacterium]